MGFALTTVVQNRPDAFDGVALFRTEHALIFLTCQLLGSLQ